MNLDWPRYRVPIAVTLAAMAAFVFAYRSARISTRVRDAETSRERNAAELVSDAPPAAKLLCASDLACVAQKAADVVAIADRTGREDVATASRALQSALVANDCRSAMAADGRIDRLDIRASDSELLSARITLMNELLGACMLADTPGPRPSPKPERLQADHSAGDADVARAVAPAAESGAGAE